MIADRPASAREGLERSRNRAGGCLLGHSVGQGEAAGDNIYGSTSKIFLPIARTQGAMFAIRRSNVVMSGSGKSGDESREPIARNRDSGS